MTPEKYENDPYLDRRHADTRDLVERIVSMRLKELHEAAFLGKDPVRHKIAHEEMEKRKEERRKLLMGAVATLIGSVITLVLALVVNGSN